MDKIECFKIQLFITDRNSLFNIEKMHPVYQILCDRWKLIAEPIMIVADPFLFVHGEKLYLFYEQKYLYKTGKIVMISTEDMQHWSEPVVVLQEHFHLSYPYVFADKGHIYMIPESCASKSVRLYEADNKKLTSFTFKKELLIEEDSEKQADISFSDSSIFNRNGIYYLNTTVNYGGVNQLRLFIADTLEGAYREHPCSPILNSSKYGRNAGCWLMEDGRLFRVAQDCEKRYGDNVHLFQIDDLSEKTYKEHMVKEFLYPAEDCFYRDGGHQLNIAHFKGKIVVATDAKEYHRYFFNRVLYKLGYYRG